ncbi:hypothetical protein [Streptomyces microflavus]|uniref:hypothetical protein n=1 Tax=Streptomyces microflavus TaxID=1919 RepID=UPI002E36F273|nr:hypothetical protein [Streptomyces microflavus]
MNDHHVPDGERAGAGSALDRAGAVFMPLMSRRYLRELARYRVLLGSGTRIPPDRAEVLVRWWELLTAVMTGHHRAMSEVFWELLRSKEPEFEGVVATMNLRYGLVETSRSEAGRDLTRALRAGGSPGSAQLSFIRYHEEISATSFWEEREIASRALRCFSADEWRQVESYVLAVQAAEDRLGHVLPWLLDGMPAERSDAVFAAFPPHMVRTYRSEWLPAYERFSARAWPRQGGS